MPANNFVPKTQRYFPENGEWDLDTVYRRPLSPAVRNGLRAACEFPVGTPVLAVAIRREHDRRSKYFGFVAVTGVIGEQYDWVSAPKRYVQIDTTPENRRWLCVGQERSRDYVHAVAVIRELEGS